MATQLKQQSAQSMASLSKRIVAALVVLCASAFVLATRISKGFTMPIQDPARVRAPELKGDRGWLNTDKPLSLTGLKGKVVLLDFWTYGCINCMHIIPDLKKLEQKYPNQLVVIGVHSAKFDNEKESENIRRIILRYEIEHPVVNDADFKIWNSYAVRAWPTQVLIDPAGYVVGSISGEGNYEAIDQAIARTIAEARKRGELNEQPVRLALEKARVGEMPLAFPGKLLADAKSDRLFIADSNHNRIVITKLNGTLIETIGTGTIGAVDGAYDRASFYRPQGLALEGDTLFVADTENHLLREIDLKSRTVKTIAGTGRQSLEYFKSGPARTIGLNSPWDLQLVGSTLYIAMAGPHQIWKYDRERQEISTFAGSGREERTDGPLTEAGFAQPSGLASDGHNLYVADSEANIVRAIDLRPGGGVRTLAGGDLFGFGDKDGEGDSVRLQHPLGLALWNNDVLIADTYNHKIKVLNPKTRQVKSFAGKGKPGQADGPAASFHEPAGLSVANGKLYIADTDNHAIRVVDLQTRVTSTLELKGLLPPSAALSDGEADVTPNAEVIKVEVQKLKLGDKPSLIIDVLLPAGYHLNPAAPQKYRVNVEKGSEAITLRPQEAARTSRDLQFPLQVKLQTAQAGLAELRASVTLYYCRADNTGTCRIKTLVWQIPVEITTVATGQSEIKLKGKILEEGSS